MFLTPAGTVRACSALIACVFLHVASESTSNQTALEAGTLSQGRLRGSAGVGRKGNTTSRNLAAVGDDTEFTKWLNQQIEADGGSFNQGYNVGLFALTLDDGLPSDLSVTASTFWHNNIYNPTQLYPNPALPDAKQTNIFCPNTDKDTDCGNGFPWDAASVGVITEGKNFYDNWSDVQQNDWGWGVFYAHDSNAADHRCRWLGSDNIWDCPGHAIDGTTGVVTEDQNKGGAGYYDQGNPYALGGGGGGGAGCHFNQDDDISQTNIDQMDSDSTDGNTVQDNDCQCNYDWKGNDAKWYDWVREALINHGVQKPDFTWRQWYKGGGKSPSWAMDTAICWVNNPRDMINMQNQIYWARREWNDASTPETDQDSSTPEEQRRYWGWNEVPVSRSKALDPKNWNTVMISLPAGICDNDSPIVKDSGGNDSPDCLSPANQQALEDNLDAMVTKNYMTVGFDGIGQKPGSDIVFVRTYVDFVFTDSNGHEDYNWQKFFFCYTWESPSGKYKVVSDGTNCYLDQR